MGRLYDLIQEHIDAQRYPVKDAVVAKQLGVTQTTLSNWREPKGMVRKAHLEAIARLTGNPFSVVRDAWLEDVGMMAPGDSDDRSDVG